MMMYEVNRPYCSNRILICSDPVEKVRFITFNIYSAAYETGRSIPNFECEIPLTRSVSFVHCVSRRLGRHFWQHHHHHYNDQGFYSSFDDIRSPAMASHTNSFEHDVFFDCHYTGSNVDISRNHCISSTPAMRNRSYNDVELCSLVRDELNNQMEKAAEYHVDDHYRVREMNNARLQRTPRRRSLSYEEPFSYYKAEDSSSSEDDFDRMFRMANPRCPPYKIFRAQMEAEEKAKRKAEREAALAGGPSTSAVLTDKSEDDKKKEHKTFYQKMLKMFGFKKSPSPPSNSKSKTKATEPSRSVSANNTPLHRSAAVKRVEPRSSGAEQPISSSSNTRNFRRINNAVGSTASPASRRSTSSNNSVTNPASNAPINREKKKTKKSQSILRPPIHYVNTKGMSGLYSRVPDYTLNSQSSVHAQNSVHHYM